jgi:hypothetical protein
MKNKNRKESSTLGITNKIKRFFFWCLLIILPLVLMEVLSFTYIKINSSKGTYRDRIEPVNSPYHPYLGYVQRPNFTFDISKKLISRKMQIKTDENGYSITPAFSDKDPDIKIIVTGGSTIFGVGSSDNSTTVPSILERIINHDLNLRAEVVNLALRGANSFQEMLLVNRYLAENKANLVLAISGVNDVGSGHSLTTVEDRFIKRSIWNNAVPLVHKAERGDLIFINFTHKLRYWSYTYDFLYRKIKHDARPMRTGSLASSESLNFNIRRDTPINFKQQAKITATHFAAAYQISKMNAADFIMILQPSAFNKKSWSAEETRRIERKWDGSDEVRETRRQNQNQFYEAFRKIDKPFQFIDLSGIFAESNETLYIDHCHYNDLAAERFAEEIFRSIQPSLQSISRR